MQFHLGKISFGYPPKKGIPWINGGNDTASDQACSLLLERS